MKIISSALIASFLVFGSAYGVYANSLVNGSFEDLAITPGTFQILNESLVSGWHTTATDQQMEIWNNYNFFGSGVVPADEGNQFIELNANLVAAVYQDLSGFNVGDNLLWSFAHRGRQGDDTVGFVITESGLDGVLDTLDDLIKDFGGFTDNTAWSTYTGHFTASFSGPMRFSWVSLGYTSASVGNFLDHAILEIDTNPVPEPATMLLFGTGIAALAGIRLKRKK